MEFYGWVGKEANGWHRRCSSCECEDLTSSDAKVAGYVLLICHIELTMVFYEDIITWIISLTCG